MKGKWWYRGKTVYGKADRSHFDYLGFNIFERDPEMQELLKQGAYQMPLFF